MTEKEIRPRYRRALKMTSSLQQNKRIEADVDNVDSEFLLDPGAAALF